MIHRFTFTSWAVLLAATLVGSVVAPADGQLKKNPAKDFNQPSPDKDGSTDPAVLFSGLTLIENAEYQGYINAARDSLKAADKAFLLGKQDVAQKRWAEAAEALQTILDNKEDYYVS